jgi:hypothetical protein
MLPIFPGLPPETLTGSSFRDRKSERRTEEAFYVEHGQQPVFIRLLALMRGKWNKLKEQAAPSGRDVMDRDFVQTSICNEPRLKPARASFP